jgi:hypothetical protein
MAASDHSMVSCPDVLLVSVKVDSTEDCFYWISAFAGMTLGMIFSLATLDAGGIL